MDSVNLSPTVNFGDCFALCSYLLTYQTLYDKYKVYIYSKDGKVTKTTCNYLALPKILSVLRYDGLSDVYVFALPLCWF